MSDVSPRKTSGFGRRTLLVQLTLEGLTNGGNLLIAAELVLHPADYQLRCQVSVRDHVTFRLLQADGAISGAGVGAVVGSHGVVDGEDDAVSRGAVAGGDGPGKCGGHGGVGVWWCGGG